MDLIARLRHWALARPRVLLVDAPGATGLRWSVEAELDRRGWQRALTPADTDLLVVLGEPGPQLGEAVDLLWSQVPEPRQRTGVRAPGGVVAALDAGRDALVRRACSGPDADDRPSPVALIGGDEAVDDERMDHGSGHEGMDRGSGHEGMDHGSGHEGHHVQHGGEVAGLPMAATGPDRDGLELDVLEVALGPVLPGWPTGLVLRGHLQGDVLTSAELAWLDADALPAAQADTDPQRAALDRLARFLDVAGWPTAARDARRARDGFAAGADRAEAQRLAEAVTRRVRRSRTLSWTAGGIGRTGAERGSGADVLSRIRRCCDVASGQPVDEPPGPSLEDVAALVEGVEVGSARLVVAGLDLTPASAGSRPEHAHG